MKVLLLGARGRMGQKMQKYLSDNNIEFLGVDVDDRKLANGYPADVIIDFSTAAALYDNLNLACKKQLPIVVATTGHDDKALQLIEHHSLHIPILLASNLSIQFNVLCELTKHLSVLNGNQFVISEVHHKYKKDAPSGSAKQLIATLSNINILPQVYSVRAGDVIGEHTLTIYGEGEQLVISHTSTDRLVYCKGALTCAEYLLDKKSGLFTMRDIIKNDC